MTTSSLTQWLRMAIEHTPILSKDGWASALGVRTSMLSQYVSGDLAPGARTLRELVLAVQSHESQEARRCSERWNELAQRPILEVHPAARTEAPMLAHYIIAPLWEDHRVAVAGLPAHEQELLLQAGIAGASRWAMARNRADAGLPMVLEDRDCWPSEREPADDVQPDAPVPQPPVLAAALPEVHGAAPPAIDSPRPESGSPVVSATASCPASPSAAPLATAGPLAHLAAEADAPQGDSATAAARLARGSIPAMPRSPHRQLAAPAWAAPVEEGGSRALDHRDLRQFDRLLRNWVPLHARLPTRAAATPDARPRHCKPPDDGAK